MLIRNSVIFILFEVLNKGIPFLLLPLLTRYLLPEDYGIYATFTTLTAFVGVFIGLSAHGAIQANYFRLTKKENARYIANSLFVLFVTFLILLIFIIIFREFVYNQIKISFEWQIVSLLVAFSQFVTLINLSLWVIEQKPVKFGLYQFFQSAIIAIATVLLIIGYNFNWQGQILAYSVGHISFACISIVVLYKRGYLTFKFDKVFITDFLKFGVPMIPHQLGAWIQGQGDKFLIITFIGINATGLFSVGQQVGLVMSILMVSLNKALNPVLFRMLNAGLDFSQKQKLVKITYLIFLGITLFGGFLCFLVYLGYPYLLGAEFQSSLLITQLIIVSFIFSGFYYTVGGYTFYFKETAKLAKITFSISVFHILLSYILLTNIGVIGAAHALIFSQAIQFLAVWHLSNKIYPLPWLSFWVTKYE